MTPYQECDRELQALGWIRTQGNGDHQKYTKEGVNGMIVLSMRMKNQGKAYKNALADIRRLEPDFPIGKKAKKKSMETDTETDDLDKVIQELDEFIKKGRAVRYTSPENRDWDKISDPNSVMNQKYIIKRFELVRDGYAQERIFIQKDDLEPGPEFPVSSLEIDSWELDFCPECKRMIPKTAFNNYETSKKIFDSKTWEELGIKRPVCNDCFQEIVDKKHKEKELKEIADDIEDENERNAFMFYCTYNINTDILDKYRKVTFASLPYTNKKVAAKEIIQEYEKFPRDARKWMKHNDYGLYTFVTQAEAFLEETKEDEYPTTPYKAWNKFKTYLQEGYYAYEMEDYDKTEFTNVYKKINNIKYSIHKKYDKQSNVTFNIINVVTPDLQTTEIVWKNNMALYKSFYKVFKPEEKTCVLLNCKEEGISQYIFNKWKEDSVNDYSVFKKLFPTEEEKLIRAGMDMKIPALKTVFQEVVNKIELFDKNISIAPNENEKEDAAAYISLTMRENDKYDFENASPVIKFFINIEKGDHQEDTYKRLKAAVDKIEYNGYPLSIYIHNNATSGIDNRTKSYRDIFGDWFENLNKKEVKDEPATIQETYGLNPGDIFLKFGINTDDSVSIDVYNPNVDENDEKYYAYLVKISKAMDECLKNNEYIRMGTLYSVKEFLKENEDHKEIFKDIITTNKNNNEMNTIDLNETNPGSENQEAGKLTTYELLKELKRRNIMCEGVKKLVPQEIDFNSI